MNYNFVIPDIKFCANIQTKSKPIFHLSANNI